MNAKSVYVIAEAGVNHNGRRDTAFALVDAAVEAGADAVKFQTFKADKLAVAHVGKATYQKTTTDGAESQFEMLQRLELPDETFLDLQHYADQKSIDFLSTPFDTDSLKFLIRNTRMPLLKMSSGELTNGPLLLDAARSGKDLVLSTGMATLDEIEAALAVIAFGYAGRGSPGRQAFTDCYASIEGREALAARVTLLQCTSEYPAPVDDINLRAMATLAERFGLRVGLSDHSEGIDIAIAAAALGAGIIEKHFTLDRGMEGPDHLASLNPADLKRMVRGIRNVERALGDGRKEPKGRECETAGVVRKVLVAATRIEAGAPFSADNMTVKRAEGGISAMEYWSYLGRMSDRHYDVDEVIA